MNHTREIVPSLNEQKALQKYKDEISINLGLKSQIAALQREIEALSNKPTKFKQISLFGIKFNLYFKK